MCATKCSIQNNFIARAKWMGMKVQRFSFLNLNVRIFEHDTNLCRIEEKQKQTSDWLKMRSERNVANKRTWRSFFKRDKNHFNFYLLVSFALHFSKRIQIWLELLLSEYIMSEMQQQQQHNQINQWLPRTLQSRHCSGWKPFKPVLIFNLLVNVFCIYQNIFEKKKIIAILDFRSYLLSHTQTT